MILLDLCCCQGGAARGYADAGFDVVGVDHEPQRRYPYPFMLADVLDVLDRLLAGSKIEFTDGRVLTLDDIDVIHASPPCQGYSITKHSHSVYHPRLVHQVRLRLLATKKPYVIENVEGTPMVRPLTLCGSEFGLTAYDPATHGTVRLERHRLFESNIPLVGAGGCKHDPTIQVAGVYGGGSQNRHHAKFVRRGGYTPSTAVRAQLLGVDWMTQDGQAQCVPPAYTRHIGTQIRDALR
jgi:DNA (cytosine-5)-methyltransferase 1